eukprot:3807003-Rhodomonas_salina.1
MRTAPPRLATSRASRKVTWLRSRAGVTSRSSSTPTALSGAAATTSTASGVPACLSAARRGLTAVFDQCGFDRCAASPL